MAPWELAVLIAYYAVLFVLAIYGLHRAHLTFVYFRSRKRKPVPEREFASLPKVAIQLPIFNEATVVERLIRSACALDYPKDRLEIQVLDDSTDETSEIAAREVESWKRRGFRIRHLRRGDRVGFKAGALAAGLRATDAEFLAVFDADFVPRPDFVRSLIHHFTDPAIGMVQARWGHINRRFSLCTRVQAILLDGHFVIEHTARNRSGRFFNFNGTAGIWRRAAILEAGGWQHDTLTEDMDLSYRAQLRGWRFVYLPEVATPAELPVEMSSFKSQQFRWAKGSLQVARKLLPQILRSNASFGQKSEAFFHLTNNLAYPLLLLLSLLLLPNLALRTTHGLREVLLIDVPLFLGTTGSIASFYLLTQREIARMNNQRAWPRMLGAFLRLPMVLSLGIGLCVNQTRAVFEAMLGRESEFVRTPKHGIRAKVEKWSGKKYRAARSIGPIIETGLALYFIFTMLVAFEHGHYLSMPFLALFLFGFGYVGAGSLWQGALGQGIRRIPAQIRQFATRSRVTPLGLGSDAE